MLHPRVTTVPSFGLRRRTSTVEGRTPVRNEAMERSGSGVLDEFDDPTELVAAGYDRVGQQYAELALLANDTRERYTDSVLERLADGSNVLDLGCGGGRPTTARLARRFKVTGVELSGVPMTRVQRNCRWSKRAPQRRSVDHVRSSFS